MDFCNCNQLQFMQFFILQELAKFYLYIYYISKPYSSKAPMSNKKTQLQDIFSKFQDSGDQQQQPANTDINNAKQSNNTIYLYQQGQFNPPPPQYQNDKQFEIFRIESTNNNQNNKCIQKIGSFSKKQISLPQLLNQIQIKISQKSSIENKISALKLLCQKINQNYKQKQNCIILYTWIQQMKLIDNFLYEDAHPQILRNMPTILRFLYENKQIQLEYINKLVHIGLKAHVQFVKVIQAILNFIAIQDLTIIFEQISSKQVNLQNNNFVMFLTTIVGNKYFVQEDLTDQYKNMHNNNNILSQTYEIQNKIQLPQILNQMQVNKKQSYQQQTHKQIIKSLTLNLYNFLIQATQQHTVIYSPILNKLISSKNIFLAHQLEITLVQLIKTGKINSVYILQYCLKLDFGQSSKLKGKKNEARFNFIAKLVNQHLYEYLLVILARVRFNKVTVDKILNIIILLSKNYKPLQDVYTQYIWKIIGLNSRQQKQRQQFFNFVKDILRNQSNFTQQSVYFIFFQILMSLRAQWFSLKIFDCLQMLFMRLNQDIKLISYIGQTYQIQNYDLVGINKFWYIYFHSKDNKVTKKCRQFLWKLTTYNNDAQIKTKIFHEYILTIITFMNQASEENKIDFCNKGFDMIDKLMQQGQKRQQTTQFVQLTVFNQCKSASVPKSISIKISQKSRLDHLTQQIAQAINPPNNNIKLLMRGQFLKGEKMTLRDLSITNGMKIMVVDGNDEAGQKKSPEQQNQNLQNNINQLLEIFGSEIDKDLLKYIAQKMQGHQLQQIVETIMNQQKLTTMTSQFQQAKQNNALLKKQNKDGYQSIQNLDQSGKNVGEVNNTQLNKESMQNQKERQQQNLMQAQQFTSPLESAKFSSVLVSNSQNLQQLLVCSQINKKRGWQTIKILPNCPQFIKYIIQKCQQQYWIELFPKQQQNEMKCAYYAHILSFILKKHPNKIKKYMIQFGGFGYIVDWVMRVGQQIGTIVLQEVTNLLVVVLQQYCKSLVGFKKRINNKQQIKLLETLQQQNKWIIGFNDTVFDSYCDESFFSWLLSLLFKTTQQITFNLSINIAQILIYYTLTNNHRLFQLLQLPPIEISHIILSHGFVGQYIFLSGLSKLLIQNNKQLKEQIYEQQLTNKFNKFLNLVDFGLQKIILQQNNINLIYLFDIVSCVLDKTNNAQKQLDITFTSIQIFRKNIQSIPPQPLSALLKSLKICLKKLFKQSNDQDIKVKLTLPLSQFSQWLFKQYLFDLEKPGRHTRNKVVRKICYDILEIICEQNRQQAESLLHKIIQIQVKERNKDEDYLDFRSQDYIGLTNLGATCYLNSLIQQLYHTKFSQLLLQKEYMGQNDLGDITQLKSIFMQLRYSIKNVVNPKKFVKCGLYYGQPVQTNIQQDAMQFLLCIFDYIENRGYKKQIYDVFGGQLCNQITGDESQQTQPFVKNNLEHFNGLTIDISGRKNLTEALAFFIKPQILDGENLYYCQQLGKKMKVSRRCYIQKMPNILILTLKRFQFDVHAQSRRKLNDYFEFPMDLDMHKYSAAYLRNKQETSDSSKYKLTGIIVHSGSAQSGHYYSYVKIGQKWFQFNDKSVTQFNIYNNLKNQCFGCSEGKKLRSAYMLFYEKVHTNYHGVYLDQLHETNFFKKQINEQNARFLKTRLIYDQNFRLFLENLQKFTSDFKLQHFIDKIFGTKKQEQEVIYYNAEQNEPLMKNSEFEEFFDLN